MESKNEILLQLKNRGERITHARRTIIEIFDEIDSPISAKELLLILENMKISVNKTTVYREIGFLLKENIINELDFGEGLKRYEIKGEEHHHVVCTDCKKTQHIDISEDFIAKEEGKIEKKSKFKISGHKIEFFGKCEDCK